MEDSYKRRFADNISAMDRNKIEEISEVIGNAVGTSPEQLRDILSDKSRFGTLTENMSESDMQRVEAVLKNPALLRALLMSPKIKQILSEFFNNK